MRALLLLLAASAAIAADENLLPREGGGWDGFAVGTQVRIKRTWLSANQVPRVTITTMELTKADDKVLTIVSRSSNAFGAANQEQTIPMPRRGEAGANEKSTEKALDKQLVFAAGKRFDCDRRQITVTGPQGKRVITEWTTAKPRLRVKREVVTYDMTGKLSARTSMLLEEFAKPRKVGKLDLPCLKYSVVQTHGGSKVEETVYVCRDVPGWTVWSNALATLNGNRAWSVRMEVLDFKVAK
ncbi:MAG: hypothetical protein ACYTGN_04325 [Planctomycetota bacterium]|jgi:hypothetical protein